MAKEGKSKPKILFWDIESSDFSADFGFVFCIGYKFLGDKNVKILRIRDSVSFAKDVTNDKEIIKDFCKVLDSADLHVTWYGAKFDFPFISTRCMMHDLPPPPNTPHLDAWRIARFKLKFNSNRLDGVSRAIPSKKGKRELKTYIEGRHWVRAKAGYEDSLRYVEKHCIADIKVLENVYLKLAKYAADSTPNLGRLIDTKERCAFCQEDRFHFRGYAVSARGRKHKAQCQNCGKWTLIPIKKAQK